MPNQDAGLRNAAAAPTSLQRLIQLRPRLGINSLLLIVMLFLALTQNASFWHQVLKGLPAEHGRQEYALMASLFVALNVLLVLVMSFFSARWLVKPFLMFFLISAAVCSYFMDAFGVVIDESMIVNTLQTNPREASELLGAPLFLHVILLGILPAVIVWRTELVTGSRWRELPRRLLLVALALVALLGAALSNYKTVSLWVRDHRQIRLYVNPTYPIYATYKHFKEAFETPSGPPAPIATDAVISPSPSGKPRVVVMVVGETARAANFQLAGYTRETTPELAATPGIVSFVDTWSCGTATAVSVPCMFSHRDRAKFNRSDARDEENLLDVLQRTGVSVLWRDNNSDCKGVCLRVPTQDLRRSKIAALCDPESCRDEVLLEGLDALISEGTQDRFIVLHLLGSHGPSYYKRYPPEFRRFVPDCAQDEVQRCSQDTIVNAYDNSILYTDHVLARLVGLLKQHEDKVDPTMIYMSDHGESLGENGIYLHGLPYAVAPDEQKHVPFVMWAPTVDYACLSARSKNAYSHDNLFHTVLGLYGVKTTEYHPAADVVQGCARQPVAAAP